MTLGSATTALAAALAATLLASGCTGGSPSSPRTSSGAARTASAGTPSTSPPSTTVRPPSTVRSMADAVLAFSEASPIATVKGMVSGTVQGSDRRSPATVQVVRLSAAPSSTVLLMRMSTPKLFLPKPAVLAAAGAREGGTAIDGVTLSVGDKRFYPGTYRYGLAVLAQNCTCTEVIRSLGPKGVWLSAEFEALPAGTTTVKLSIPGFPTAEVPVTAAGPRAPSGG